MLEEKLWELLRETGAFLEGHFLLSSGLHSGHYLQCAMLLRYPRYAALIGEEIGKLVKKYEPEVVVSPALGGIIVGHEVARFLDVPFLFCERESGVFKLRRFPFPKGKRALVVEDVITTGGSSAEVGGVVEREGGIWVHTACIVDRSGGKHSLPHEPTSLLKVSFPNYKPEECPLCQKGLPIYKPGSRNL